MRQLGMTLVELLVVLVMASVIGIFVLNLFVTSNRTYMDQNKVLDVQRDGRVVMESITRTLREAGLNPLNSASFDGVKQIASSNIIIDRDLDLDGVLDDGEIVSFRVNFGVLKRSVLDVNGNIVRSQDIARNVKLFELEWFDSAGVSSPAPAPEDIRTIAVTISFEDSKYLGGNFTRTYSTRVDLRNR